MSKELIFPKIEGFSFAVSRNEIPLDTKEEAVLLIAEEDIEIVLCRRVYALTKGDALLALPCSYLRIREEGAAFFGYTISFPKDFLHTACPNLYFNRIDDGIALSFAPKSAHRLLEMAVALFEGRNAPVYALIDIFSILENESIAEAERLLEIPLPAVLRRALAYIEEIVPIAPDSSALAARYGISQTTLLRLFRKHLATTPRKYAQALRILKEQKNGVD